MSEFDSEFNTFLVAHWHAPPTLVQTEFDLNLTTNEVEYRYQYPDNLYLGSDPLDGPGLLCTGDSDLALDCLGEALAVDHDTPIATNTIPPSDSDRDDSDSGYFFLGPATHGPAWYDDPNAFPSVGYDGPRADIREMYAADQQAIGVPWPPVALYDVPPCQWQLELGESESESISAPGPVRHTAAGARKERAFDPIMVNGRSRPLSAAVLRQDEKEMEIMESLAATSHSASSSSSSSRKTQRATRTTGKTKDPLRKWGLMVEGVRYETAREYADRYPEEFKKAYPKYARYVNV
ncbi:hypothetical protein C8F01DRAFT_1373493 [Mycena amicta]|nr:hypothetical protein C8F01DRAFT_1373493 [Mycena amicta]